MLIDNLFDRLARRFRRSGREGPNESPPSPNGRRTGELRFRRGIYVLNGLGSWNSGSSQHKSGFFNDANHFAIDRSTFIENRGKIINNFVAGTGEQTRLRFQPPLALSREYLGFQLLTLCLNAS
jgi:hypothetical protein